MSNVRTGGRITSLGRHRRDAAGAEADDVQVRERYPTDAGLGRRAFARLLDAGVLGAVGGFALASLASDPDVPQRALEALAIGRETDATRVVVHVVTSLVAIGYFTVFETTRGRTPGKIVLGLEVIGADGATPGARASFIRNAWLLLPILPWVGTLAMGLFAAVIAMSIVGSRTNTGWHDDLADTAVVVSRSSGSR